MEKMVLTQRGKFVIKLLLIALLALFVWWAYDITTPVECKVPVEKMSHACKQLIYEVP